MQVVHLEMNEFMSYLYAHKHQVKTRVIVLDCGIAGMVYFFAEGEELYYYDNFFCSKQKEDDLSDAMSKQELHAELYWKIALDFSVHLRS